MKNCQTTFAISLITGLIGVGALGAPVMATEPAPTSMPDAVCATIPDDLTFGSWKHVSKVEDCLRALAVEDWIQARAEATHIGAWGFTVPTLNELIDTLSRYDSANAVRSAMSTLGLLSGTGSPGTIKYFGEDWQPITGSDWLIKAGKRLSFDAETGTHPNYHDLLLSELAELFGAAMEGAEFAETAPHWDSEDPYELRATLGDREWRRQAANYGDWFDVAAVLDLLNEMAAATGTPDRIMPLETYDQTVTVVVGPGASLIAATRDGLISPAGASHSRERGEAFEKEVRRRYRIDGE